jgi:hypothetical protein
MLGADVLGFEGVVGEAEARVQLAQGFDVRAFDRVGHDGVGGDFAVAIAVLDFDDFVAAGVNPHDLIGGNMRAVELEVANRQALLRVRHATIR